MSKRKPEKEIPNRFYETKDGLIQELQKQLKDITDAIPEEYWMGGRLDSVKYLVKCVNNLRLELNRRP